MTQLKSAAGNTIMVWQKTAPTCGCWVSSPGWEIIEAWDDYRLYYNGICQGCYCSLVAAQNAAIDIIEGK